MSYLPDDYLSGKETVQTSDCLTPVLTINLHEERTSRGG